MKLIPLTISVMLQIQSRNHLIAIAFTPTYVPPIIESMPLHRDTRTWTIIVIPISTGVSRAARDCICFCTCRLLPISANARKTEKESHAYMPFLVRINAIEGKVWSSHVHAPATHLESRDHSFCQLTTTWCFFSVCTPLVL